MAEGRVLAAARTKGLHSLTKIAQALLNQRPELFEGVEARSLAAKLSELNRDKLTWWRSRADQLRALQDLIGIEPDDLVASDTARRRGLWVCDEFPELPALNLSNDLVLELAKAVPDGKASCPTSLESWMCVGTASDYAQHGMMRPDPHVRWLHVPRGIGRRLLLERFKARGRLDVVEAETLREAVAMASRFHPVVLAPSTAVSVAELETLALLGDEQPVLVVSAHALPRVANDAEAPHSFPSWDWLTATRTDRARSAFGAGTHNMSGGLFAGEPIIGFRMELVPTWRDDLLQWIEGRFTGRVETLYSAEGLRCWLAAFDPNQVAFPTPAAVLSLARICHEVGERQLPKADSPSAGMQLVRRLGRADSRYQSILIRLVARSWLDVDHQWADAKPWSNWCSLSAPLQKNKAANGGPRHRLAGVQALTAQPQDTVPSESELDAAVKAGMLLVDHDGHYGFRSYAEAVLILRDQLRQWMLAGEIDKWAAQTVGDLVRQRLVDVVLATLSNRDLIEMSKAAAQLPVWTAAALGATEALFLAVGQRMASGTLHFNTELQDLLTHVLTRCVNDETSVLLPLGRPKLDALEQVDWLRASWGWSLMAPRPAWLPEVMAQHFPAWADHEVDWLSLFPTPSKEEVLTAPHARRIAQTVQTAVEVARRIGIGESESYAPASLTAIIGLLRAARGEQRAESAWWFAINEDHWWAPSTLKRLLNAGEGLHQNELAASLLDACADAQRTGSILVTLGLMRSRLWQEILDVRDARELFFKLTPAALQYVALHLQTVPPALREHVAREIPPEQLPQHYNWLTLVKAAGPPRLERIDALLRANGLQAVALANALWSVHPQDCMQWATDPDNPHHELFLWMCPIQWTAALTEIQQSDPERAEKLSISATWLADRISHSRAAAPTLLSLLSVHRMSTPDEME